MLIIIPMILCLIFGWIVLSARNLFTPIMAIVYVAFSICPALNIIVGIGLMLYILISGIIYRGSYTDSEVEYEDYPIDDKKLAGRILLWLYGIKK